MPWCPINILTNFFTWITANSRLTYSHYWLCWCRPYHHTTTVLRLFFRDHAGQPVPEENFWTSWCKGRLTEVDTPTIQLGATPSGLASAHLHHTPLFLQAGCPSCLPTNSLKALKALMSALLLHKIPGLVQNTFKGDLTVFTVTAHTTSSVKFGIKYPVCFWNNMSWQSARQHQSSISVKQNIPTVKNCNSASMLLSRVIRK